MGRLKEHQALSRRPCYDSSEVPIYEYRCRQCEQPFELLVLGSTVPACPSCQSRDLEQLLSGFAVSSDGSRQANVQSARRARLSSGDYKDQKIAESDYVKNHKD
jgi:putative FmdB family regulatory protein